MGRGGHQQKDVEKQISWEEVRKHDKKESRWIVLDGQVYDVTDWIHRHPGGSRVITHYSGQDATDAFTAFHKDQVAVRKYLKALHVGTLSDGTEREIDRDFRDLRETAKKMGLFTPSYTFYALHMAHILIMEVLAYFTVWYFGIGWIPYLVSLLLYSTVQAQIGWLQHDFGHLSVAKTSYWDRVIHRFTIGFIMGASASWWKHMHNQHHAKPNVMNKDPDVRVDQLFVIGEQMPVEIAKARKKSAPYDWQHRYFFLVGPPMLFPVYFQFMLIRHIITRREWLDLAILVAYFTKFIAVYFPVLGWRMILFYLAARCLESHWFTWVSQSNHIPMNIKADESQPWLKLQIHATCDIEKSFFNDWFTGHLNFQIEHHLFPMMPRHNLYKIAPLVKTLCEKHGVPYTVKTLGQAFRDIVKTLKNSGELWHDTYQQYHSS